MPKSQTESQKDTDDYNGKKKAASREAATLMALGDSALPKPKTKSLPRLNGMGGLLGR